MAFIELYIAATGVTLASILFVLDVLVPFLPRSKKFTYALKFLVVVLLPLFVVGIVIVFLSRL